MEQKRLKCRKNRLAILANYGEYMKADIAMELFEAYAQNKLPETQGLIISAFFKEDSAYSIYEVVSYSDIKDIYMTSDALHFKAKGKKILLIAEPPKFAQKNKEPFKRTNGCKVELSFSESFVNIAESKAKLIFNKKEIDMPDGFEVLKPEGINFSFLFYSNNSENNDDKNDNENTDSKTGIENLADFLIKSLNQEAIIPLADAEKTAKQFLDILNK